MNTKITFVGIENSTAIEEYATKKMLSLSKFIDLPDMALCEIELARTTKHHKSGDIFKAEVNITIGGTQYYAVAERDDLYVAIDELRDEAQRVITSRKKKYMATFRRGASKLKEMLKRLYK